MNCTSCQKVIHLYLGDELEPQRQTAIEAHLTDCHDCRCAAENWQRWLDALWQAFPLSIINEAQ